MWIELFVMCFFGGENLPVHHKIYADLIFIDMFKI